MSAYSWWNVRMPKPDLFCGICYLTNVPAWPIHYCADCVEKRVTDMTEFEEFLLKQTKNADKTIHRMAEEIDKANKTILKMNFNFHVLLGIVARLGGVKMHDEIVQEYERLMMIEEEE